MGIKGVRLPSVFERYRPMTVLSQGSIAYRRPLQSLLLKMDIEGADVEVWDDLIRSNIFCSLRDQGTRMFAILDPQSARDDAKARSRFADHCAACGVTLRWLALQCHGCISEPLPEYRYTSMHADIRADEL